MERVVAWKLFFLQRLLFPSYFCSVPPLRLLTRLLRMTFFWFENRFLFILWDQTSKLQWVRTPTEYLEGRGLCLFFSLQVPQSIKQCLACTMYYWICNIQKIIVECWKSSTYKFTFDWAEVFFPLSVCSNLEHFERVH